MGSTQNKQGIKENDPKNKSFYHSFDKRCINIISYTIWVFINTKLTLLFEVGCKMVFDPRGGRMNMINKNGCCHGDTCRPKDKSFSRGRR